MPDKRQPDVLGALPRTRPHRRSEKRGSRPAVESEAGGGATGGGATGGGAGGGAGDSTGASAASAAQSKAKSPSRGAKPKAANRPATARRARPETLRQPAQPGGTPRMPRSRKPAPTSAPSSPAVLGTAIQAAAELAEIGLSVSARALRRAVSRLPRP